MDINYLIQLLGNRLTALNLAKDQAFQAGDLERINAISGEILEVQSTLQKLNLVSSIEQVASTTPFTEAQVVQYGIDASSGIVGLSQGGTASCMDEYDISPYATDPLHEQKIKDILEHMGFMDSAEKVNMYIQQASLGSPVTGDMVMRASAQFAVDTRLLMAIMELDSRFGTLGIGARTFNPGNVGNTGTEMRTYASWDDGVSAVALWLSNHRKTKTPTPIPAVVPSVEPVAVEPVIDTTPVTSPEVVTPPVSEPVVSETSVNTPTNADSAPVAPDVPSIEVPVVNEVIPTDVQPNTTTGDAPVSVMKSMPKRKIV